MIKKIFISAKERENVVDRTIESFEYNGKIYAITESYPIGITQIDDCGYLTFMCKLGKKRIDIYCEEYRENGITTHYKYFALEKYK